MKTYTYQAIDENTRNMVKGTVRASDLNSFLERMRSEGYIVLEVKKALFDPSRLSFLRPAPRLSLEKKGHLLTEVSTLLEAGIPTHRAFEFLADEPDPVVSRLARSICSSLEKGMLLHQALAEHQDSFPGWEIHSVRAAEASGTLADTLKYLGQQAVKTSELQSKVRSSLTYPALVFAVGIVVTAVLVGIVVPSLSGLIGGYDNLPTITKGVISFATFLRRYFLLILGVILVAAGGLLHFGSRSQVAKRLELWLFKMPRLGKLLLVLNLTRFCRAFGMLLRSGVPAAQAVELACESTGSAVFVELGARLRKEVESGTRLSEAMRASGRFPSLMTEIVTVGENSGSLDELSIKIWEFYQGEAARLTASLSSMIEPVLLLAIGIVVGFIAVSVFMPMVNVLNTLTDMP